MRNDNVDIQLNQDSLSNGYNVGWIETDEWMKYSFSLIQEGFITLMLGSLLKIMMVHFILKLKMIKSLKLLNVIKTDSWEDWINIMVDSLVIIKTSDENFIFHVDKGTFNLSFFKFKRLGDISMLNLSTFHLSQIMKIPFWLL